MKTVTLSKIEHRGATRIRVDFPYDSTIIQAIKKIEGSRWSQSKKCWHVPYSKENYALLQKHFEVNVHKEKKPPSPDSSKIEKKPIQTTADNFQSIKKDGRTFKKVVGQKIILEQEDEQWIQAFVPFDKKGWIAIVKHITGRKWDAIQKCWVIPNVKESYRFIKHEIGLDNVTFQFKIPTNIPEYYATPKKITNSTKKKSFLEQLSQIHRDALTQLEERLLLERLSPSTRKTYKHHLAGLFFYCKDIAPEDISLEQVQYYLLYKIRNKKIAESTQNQIINAVKAYWEKVLKRDKSYIDIPRPKKPKKLPNVLSSEEVVRLIDCVDNPKHKLILLLIYSAGLRLGEVVNLLCRDINMSRMHIHIKGGKGKKDRYVALAESVLPFLVDYKKQYAPKRWLFEGQNGGKYSKRSVQNIFKKAVIKSRVNPYATVHTLRHSYATHCVEDGHPMKAIQDALGHASPETTQIYIHMSSTSLRKLKSPLDKLKIKKK